MGEKMEKKINTKALLIGLSLFIIITLTIAFASIARQLKVAGEGTMDPANCDIPFKNLSEPEIKGGAEVTGTPTIATKGVSMNNMDVTLKLPGDSVTYTVDIENSGDINVEISDITHTDLDSSLLELEIYYTDTEDRVQTGDELYPGETKNITIKIKYEDIENPDLLPDEVQTIRFSYSITYTQSNHYVAMYNIGDRFCLNNDLECFYVISDNRDTVTAIAQYNIITTTNRQSNTEELVAFAETNYWYDRSTKKLKTEYGTGYPTWVFDSNSNLWNPIQNYRDYLATTLGKTSVTATLMSKEQIDELKTLNGGTLPTWTYKNTVRYWLGNANGTNTIWRVDSNGSVEARNYKNSSYRNGIRPVITISKSDL